jgi:hypothetical protein
MRASSAAMSPVRRDWTGCALAWFYLLAHINAGVSVGEKASPNCAHLVRCSLREKDAQPECVGLVGDL